MYHFLLHKTVTGQVADHQVHPLPGVNVLIEGTSQGAITDAQGNYEIQASADDVIRFGLSVNFNTL